MRYKPNSRIRRYWGYIYNGELLRYDVPGNIVAGYGAAHIEISLEDAHKGADYAQKGGTDDPFDQDYISNGYNLYLKRNNY